MLKAIKRTPHVVTSKVGMAKSSNDIEVDDLKRRFAAIEEESTKLLKDAKAYREAVSSSWSIHSEKPFEAMKKSLALW